LLRVLLLRLGAMSTGSGCAVGRNFGLMLRGLADGQCFDRTLSRLDQ
jgi:hypothetical protein